MKTLLLILALAGIASADTCITFKLTPSGLVCEKTFERKRTTQIAANAFMIVGSALDCYTTVKAVKNGARELNPLMRPFSHSFGACMGFKSAIMIPVGVMGWRKDSIRGQVVVGAIGTGLGVWNSFQW